MRTTVTARRRRARLVTGSVTNLIVLVCLIGCASTGCIQDAKLRVDAGDGDGRERDAEAAMEPDEEEEADAAMEEGSGSSDAGAQHDAQLMDASGAQDAGLGQDAKTSTSTDAQVDANAQDGGAMQTGSCGALGQACCASGSSCQTDLNCLGGTTCSCAKKVVGPYVIRADGAVLHYVVNVATPTVVLRADNAAPLLGAVDVTGFWQPSNTRPYGCAVLANGSVWCWRSGVMGNALGALGSGTTEGDGPVFRATQVLTAANTPLMGMREFASSYGHSVCAVGGDERLYCWGEVTWLINNGAFKVSPYAQAITTDGATPLAGVVQASVGPGNACAVLRTAGNREVWCWGANDSYGLGQGDIMHRQYPVKVPGLVDPTQVAVSMAVYFTNTSACATVEGGKVRCWGYNSYGQAGTGNTNTPVMSPTTVKLADGVTPLDGVLDLRPFDFNMCALRSGNTLWCWGNGYRPYASNFGATNVVQVSNAEPDFLTSDGKAHWENKTFDVKCGALD